MTITRLTASYARTHWRADVYATSVLRAATLPLLACVLWFGVFVAILRLGD